MISLSVGARAAEEILIALTAAKSCHSLARKSELIATAQAQFAQLTEAMAMLSHDHLRASLQASLTGAQQ